jgi:hypothetical protein
MSFAAHRRPSVPSAGIARLCALIAIAARIASSTACAAHDQIVARNIACGAARATTFSRASANLKFAQERT